MFMEDQITTKIGLVHRYMEEWWTNDNDMNNEKIILLSLEGHKRKGGQFQSFASPLYYRNGQENEEFEQKV